MSRFRSAHASPQPDPTRVQFSSVSSGLKKDRTAEGQSLDVPLNYVDSSKSLRVARDRACKAFVDKHGSYKVDRNRRLLMKITDDVNSTLSASHVSWKQLIPELIFTGCIFQDLPLKEHIAYLKTLESTVTRRVIEDRKGQIRMFFDQYIRCSQPTQECDLVSDYDRFIAFATSALAGDSARVPRLFRDQWSAGTGFAAKLKPDSKSEIDPDAGIRSKTDFYIRYGHPSYRGKILLGNEAKFFDMRPDLARPWLHLKENHLPELMATLVGKLPTFTVATCNYGQKVFRVETNQNDNTSTIYQSPPGPCYLDFEDEGAWELVFDFWLEIAALAVLPGKCPGSGNKRKVAVLAKEPLTLRKQSKAPESPKKPRLNVKTSTGDVVEFCSVDLAAVFTREELSQLRETVVQERQDEEDCDAAIEGQSADVKDLVSTVDDQLSIEAITPPFARNLA